ncbi:uncharacterized protein METZ01_LOCUS276888, partial [marine metagenome]
PARNSRHTIPAWPRWSGKFFATPGGATNAPPSVSRPATYRASTRSKPPSSSGQRNSTISTSSTSGSRTRS